MGVVLNVNTPAYQATPANPTGTTNTTGLMMGLAGAITPLYTGRVFISIVGCLSNNTGTAGNGAKVHIRTGTGSAPTNGAALTGTVQGSAFLTSVLERATANDLQTFTLTAIVQGLTLGTAIWIDIGLAAVVGGTGRAESISISAFEF